MVPRPEKVNHFDYAINAKALSSVKLKWSTQNGRKQQSLIDSRQDIEGDMYQYAKYMSQLKNRANKKHYKKSVSILRQCEQDGIEPNIVIYSKVLDNCANCFAPNMVGIKILREMIIKYNIKPNHIIFSSILKLFFNNGSYHDCIILFKLTQSNIDIDYKDLFKNDYQKSREISYVLTSERLLNNIKEIDTNANEICANIILKCLGKLGNMSKVTEFFYGMIRAGNVPTDITMNQFINIFGNNGKIRKMEALFQWWLDNEQRLNIKPDIITINSMLNAYGKIGDVDKCEELFNSYCSKEHEIKFYLKPTVITFSHIITCIANAIDKVNENNVEERQKLKERGLKYYKKMQIIYGMDDYYNSVTTAIMNVCLKCNDLMTLLRIFDERRVKDPLDRQMYNIAFRGLFDNGLIGEALTLFEEGWQHNVLKYLHPSGPYSMDLHGFDVATSVIAIMHNLRTICNNIKDNENFKVPSIWIVVGKGTHSDKKQPNQGKYQLLRDSLPNMLRDERLFDPPLETFIPDWNTGRMKIDDKSLLQYLAIQLKMDPEDLRPRLVAFQPQHNTFEGDT